MKYSTSNTQVSFSHLNSGVGGKGSYGFVGKSGVNLFTNGKLRLVRSLAVTSSLFCFYQKTTRLLYVFRNKIKFGPGKLDVNSNTSKPDVNSKSWNLDVNSNSWKLDVNSSSRNLNVNSCTWNLDRKSV